MKQTAYDELVRIKGMLPVKKIQLGNYDVYISDGFCPKGDFEESASHYKTGYGFGRDNEIYIAEHYTTKFLSGATPVERMKDCEKRAMEMLANFKETGCLKQ